MASGNFKRRLRGMYDPQGTTTYCLYSLHVQFEKVHPASFQRHVFKVPVGDFCVSFFAEETWAQQKSPQGQTGLPYCDCFPKLSRSKMKRNSKCSWDSSPITVSRFRRSFNNLSMCVFNNESPFTSNIIKKSRLTHFSQTDPGRAQTQVKWKYLCL